jgi:hypothetical protein
MFIANELKSMNKEKAPKNTFSRPQPLSPEAALAENESQF